MNTCGAASTPIVTNEVLFCTRERYHDGPHLAVVAWTRDHYETPSLFEPLQAPPTTVFDEAAKIGASR